MTHPSTDDLHDALDGLLPPVEEERLRRHLDACAACREEAAALGALVEALRGLPDEARPTRDLWPGVAARLEASGTEPDRAVVPLRVTGAAAGARRRISLTLPQLSAAAAVVALLSAATLWGTLRRPAGGGGEPPATPAVLAADRGAEAMESAVADLERALAEGRGLLAPETLAAVETSLAVIDLAMAEARAALAADPASGVLNRLLTSHQKTKLRILRQATSGMTPAA